jgi:hypothetical protein
MLRLRIRGAIPAFLHTPSYRGALNKHKEKFGVKGICILCARYSDFKPRRTGRDLMFIATVFGKVVTFANECGII